MTDNHQQLIEKATAWAREWLGSTEYSTRCLAFVEDAYERANSLEVFGGDTAHESAVLYEASDGGEPPAGALVFYDCSGPLRGESRNWGHVGLALGGGEVIHAWHVVRIDHYLAVPELPGAPGWTAPAYVGWVPVARLLVGSRPRVWPADAP